MTTLTASALDVGVGAGWEALDAANDCVHPLDEVDWNDAGLVVSLVVLGLINVLVIVGNILVVLAVFLDARLRTVTNLFIVSLAMADLLVGLAVLPFSATMEVLHLWIFGELWCSVWLAVDVWMCTASILNLCAISLDRYLAVTRPVSYPSIMSKRRAKILLAVVWSLSFLICFPPLVGWNDRQAERGTSALTGREHCANWSCELTNDAGYVVYSALGSFFLPMLVMLFFYWRIYRAAVETTKAINQGFRTTKEGGTTGALANGLDSDGGAERLTLRIHRGRSGHKLPKTTLLMQKHGVPPPGFGFTMAALQHRSTPQQPASAASDTGVVLSVTGAGTSSVASVAVAASAANTGIKSMAGLNGGDACDLCDGPSPPVLSSAQAAVSYLNAGIAGVCCRSHNGSTTASDDAVSVGSTSAGRLSLGSASTTTGYSRENVSQPPAAYRILYAETALGGGLGAPPPFVKAAPRRSKSSASQSALPFFRRPSARPTPTPAPPSQAPPQRCKVPLLRFGSGVGGGDTRRRSRASEASRRLSTCQPNMAALEAGIAKRRASTSDCGAAATRPVPKMNRRNIKAQVKRFKMETKAAKTLGIIVGGFILCWMPFFTMYVVRAFCPDRIPPLLFSILFWLGYCNSAINPCIYAMFSKDFRFAFKMIVCRCLCTRQSHACHGRGRSIHRHHRDSQRHVLSSSVASSAFTTTGVASSQLSNLRCFSEDSQEFANEQSESS